MRNRTWFDVIVSSDLFREHPLDLGPATTGTMAVAPRRDVDPRGYPCRFEPVHGSAPDITGKGIANPVGHLVGRRGTAQEHLLGHPEAAAAIVKAIETLFAETDVRTAERQATCKELGSACVDLGVGRVG